MNKPFKIKAINKSLYDIRNQKKITLKDAAKSLGISKLHLNLIEKGYLHVAKKLQPKFIKYYQLKDNFFSVNTTYVVPINIKYEDPGLEKKARDRIKKKKTKIISGVISALLFGVLGAGAYYFTRDDINPRAMWTSEFTTFRKEFIKIADSKPSVEYPGDVIYYIENEDTNFDWRISIPGKDINATGLKFTYEGFESFIYNKKIFIFDRQITKNEHAYVICTYSKKGEYNIPKIRLTEKETATDYYPGSPQYKRVYDITINFFETDFIPAINEIITNLSLPSTFDKIMNDVEKISVHQVFGFRLGFRLILFPAILLVLSLSVFTYAMIKGHRYKPKKVKEKPYAVHKTEYSANPALVYRTMPNDTNFPMVVPEFVLRILALVILLLASIGTVWLTSSVLNGQETIQASAFDDYASNFLVAGITLAFFLKLDVYHKKTNRQLLENIIILFVFGLVFYVAECTAYACLSTQGTIYSALINLFSGLLPGNIIWNLMLYSLIFFFLFTLPKKIENEPHKVLIWRLGSAIPTLLLLAAFMYKGTFQGVVSPYVSFLFHTNGLLSTAFAIFYLYSLFFFQQYVTLKYGREFTKVFVDSRRYAIKKNVIACIVIALLTLIDLAFFFYLPDNNLKLGNNWIIAILIPFILLYRPHIGKRDPKWDLAYITMYVIFLTGGFLVAFNMIINALDLSQIQQIIS